MLRSRCTVTAAAAAALTLLVVARPDVAAWPPPAKAPTVKKTTSSKAKSTKAPHTSSRYTHANRRAGARRFVVQVRHPLWVRSAAMTPQAAELSRRMLHRTGWFTRSVTTPQGVVVMHRMRHWHTRANVLTPAAAQQLVAYYQSQGFLARALPR
jgi:hypothetical protein